MDSGQYLTSSPSAPPSSQEVSSVSTSSPAPPQIITNKYIPAASTDGSISPFIVGQTPQAVGEHSNRHSCPAFGLFTSSLSPSEFGGRGNLGISTLPTHTQFKTLPDLWRPTGKNSRAVFHPLLGLHPFFAPAFKIHNPADSQFCLPGVNECSTSSPKRNSNVSLLPAKKRKKTQTNSSWSQKSLCEHMQYQKNILTSKRKDPMKRSIETPRFNGRLLGCLSESSSETSSDSDNKEKDYEDLSSDGDSSDSEREIPVEKKVSAKHLTHNTSESKARGPFLGSENACQESLCHSIPATSSDQLQSRSHLVGLPVCAALFLHSARTAEEKSQQHTSVIHPTGLATHNSSLMQSRSETHPSHTNPAPNQIPLKYNSIITPSKHQIPPPSMSKHQCAGLLKPRRTKPTTLFASNHSSCDYKTLMTQSKTARHVDRVNEGKRNSTCDSLLHLKTLNLKKPVLLDSLKTSFVRPKNQLCDPKQFLKPHLNKAISTAGQDAPLALITKPRSQTNSPVSRPLLAAASLPYLTPINLSTGATKASYTAASKPKSSAPSGLAPLSIKAPSVLHEGWRPEKTISCQKPLDLTRSRVSDFHSSKASEDSSEDRGDEESLDSLESYSGSSLSDLGSNPESDGAEHHRKKCFKAEQHSDADRRAALPKLQVTKPLGGSIYQGNMLPLAFTTTPDLRKRRRVTDEKLLKVPLQFGWQRETRLRTFAGRLQGEVIYFAPCGKKLRQYPDVVKYLVRHGITEISRDNFSFSTKIKVGNFYKGREGPEGLQWFLVAEEDVAPCVVAMDGRHGRQTQSKRQPGASVPRAKYRHPVNYREPLLQNVSDPKLLRKLEAQEIAQQAAQIKMMRKLEKQAMAQAKKEAKKQRAKLAAEERQKKREEKKIHKQQEKIKRIQHIRMEKELRAQQVFEAKKKRKEASAHLKMLETEKRNKEREIRKLQSVIQKHQSFSQEQERYRLDMERERRRQHMVLMKAVEAWKKAEEKERLKKEKKEEKQINKMKKLELMKPKEDMCLADHQPLPELSCIPEPAKTFSNCLMVLQFVRNFGAVLKLGLNSNRLSLSDFQDGLLNIGNSLQKVQDLLVGLLSAAVCDPGLPAGHKCKTLLGDHLSNVKINRDNVSEILRIYMEAHPEQTEVTALACSLQTKAFQAHSPSEKASMLAFLVNELCCSKAVISKIDRNIDYMSSLRKDKWVLEGKLRKLRNIHAKKTEKRNNNVGEVNHTMSRVVVQNKCKRTSGDSEEEEDDYSEDNGEDYDEEEEELRGKTRKKAEVCGEEEATKQSGDFNRLQTKIQKTCKLQSEISQKLFKASHLLRSMTAGEDRYRRRYWLLPECGGIFVEGVENDWEEERQNVSVKVEEQQQEEISEQRIGNAKAKAQCQQSNDDNLLQGALPERNKPLEAAKTDQDSNIDAQRTYPTQVSITEPRQTSCASQTDKTSVSVVLGASQLSDNCMKRSFQSILPYDQLSKIFTEKSSEWFSLLPRSPCDSSPVVSNSSCPAFPPSSHLVRTKPSSFLLQNTPRKNTEAGNNTIHSAFSQEPEGNRDKDLCLADCNSVEESETTESLSNKPAAASRSGLEVAKTQDSTFPQPVPEEMIRGWWRISDEENLRSLVKALHSRGIRERLLQKQIQKDMEHIAQIYANRTNEFDTKDPEMQRISREIFEGWCVEQRAVEVDTSLLLQVEDLEKNVISANLHIQGWKPGVPQYNRQDLEYFESKPSSSLSLENKTEKFPGFPNNPLDIAVSRLAELERNIKQSNKEEVGAGMSQWHKALGQVRSSAQLSLCIQRLQKSIVWKRDVMKAHCQFCQKGDNEEVLLLCDDCDQGCHTYCHNPKITAVPTGAWFCSSCESGRIPLSLKRQSQTTGGKQKGSEVKQNGKPSVKGVLISEAVASSNNAPKRGSKDLKKKNGEDGSQAEYDTPASCPKKARTPKDSNSELAVCRVLLAELEAHRDAWPFLSPVKHKSVPGYRKVIKKPMDFSTIKEKLTNNLYLNPEPFIIDVNKVFDNCQRFNENDSEIGRAGHRMRRFFDKRWTELLHF